MIKPGDPRLLASDILSRSICTIRVGAAIVDPKGRVVSWGWNSVGGGFGLCAERHAILRGSKRRLSGATIYVASERRRNGKMVPSKPCRECQAAIDGWGMTVVWRDNDGSWIME